MPPRFAVTASVFLATWLHGGATAPEALDPNGKMSMTVNPDGTIVHHKSGHLPRSNPEKKRHHAARRPKDGNMTMSHKHAMVETHGFASTGACDPKQCGSYCVWRKGQAANSYSYECANDEEVLAGRKSSRGPFSFTVSCLPAFGDNKQICGHRNPLLVLEAALHPNVRAARKVSFETDDGTGWAHMQARKNVHKLKNRYGISGFITLESGHKAECGTERSLPADPADGSPAPAMKRRSCADDAVGFQNQGDPLVLRTWARAFMEQNFGDNASSIALTTENKEATTKMIHDATKPEVNPAEDTNRWKLVPIPDGGAPRLPYFMLWRKYADDMFNNQEICGEKTDGKLNNPCRISTHCVGGNGRTGMMLMGYFLHQLSKGEVLAQGDDTNPNDNPAEFVKLVDKGKDFDALRAKYYDDLTDFTELGADDCVNNFCSSNKIEYLRTNGVLPDIDSTKPDNATARTKLKLRCKIACALAAREGVVDDAAPTEAVGRWTAGKTYRRRAGTEEASAYVPYPVMHALTTVFTMRGLKSGEFFHVMADNRVPGNLMRLVQWWQCLKDASWTIKYKVKVTSHTTPHVDHGEHTITLDCKDPSIFAPNEFGIYVNTNAAGRSGWATGADKAAQELLVGPEETGKAFFPTKHELAGGIDGKWGGQLAAACNASGIQEGQKDPMDCLDENKWSSECDTMECKGADDDKIKELREARNLEPSYKYFINMHSCAHKLIGAATADNNPKPFATVNAEC